MWSWAVELPESLTVWRMWDEETGWKWDPRVQQSSRTVIYWLLLMSMFYKQNIFSVLFFPYCVHVHINLPVILGNIKQSYEICKDCQCLVDCKINLRFYWEMRASKERRGIYWVSYNLKQWLSMYKIKSYNFSVWRHNVERKDFN